MTASGSANQPGTWATIKAHLAADKRKTIALAVLTVVMCVIWVRLALKGGNEPAMAVAALSPSLVASVAEPEAPAAGSAEGQEPVVRDMKRTRVTPVVDIRGVKRDLERDFFMVDWRQFANATGGETSAEAKRAVTPSTWERVAASVRKERERKRRDTEHVRKQSEQLTVQSTMIGNPSSAMISGHFVHVGDRVDGFEVVGIEPRAVVVRKDGVRITIRMP